MTRFLASSLLLALAGGLSADDAQDRAIRAVEAVGGTVDVVPGRSANVDLIGKPMPEGGLKRLAGLRHVKVLWLSGAGVTDAGLDGLGEFKELEDLDLDGTPVTLARVKELAALEQLRHLWLADSHVRMKG